MQFLSDNRARCIWGAITTLIFHGGVPVDEIVTFLPLKVGGVEYRGRALFDVLSQVVHRLHVHVRSAASVADTSDGESIRYEIAALELLLRAYRNNVLPELTA